jgi:DNA-binding transcriptional ArsR family regulator
VFRSQRWNLKRLLRRRPSRSSRTSARYWRRDPLAVPDNRDGRQRAYAGELARHAAVAPSTASEHLSRLLDAGFITVEGQGRYRYIRIAGAEIAQMLESL